jgi:hypothetical protein
MEVAMNPTATAHARSRREHRDRSHGHKKTSLRRAPRDPDGGDAFVRDFRTAGRRIRAADAEAFGELFVLAITSNDAVAEIARDEVDPEELGGVIVDLEEGDTPDPSG